MMSYGPQKSMWEQYARWVVNISYSQDMLKFHILTHWLTDGRTDGRIHFILHVVYHVLLHVLICSSHYSTIDKIRLGERPPAQVTWSRQLFIVRLGWRETNRQKTWRSLTWPTTRNRFVYTSYTSLSCLAVDVLYSVQINIFYVFFFRLFCRSC